MRELERKDMQIRMHQKEAKAMSSQQDKIAEMEMMKSELKTHIEMKHQAIS